MYTPTIIALALFSAALPVLFWFFILKRKNRKHMMPRFILTFLCSGIGAMVALQYGPDLQTMLKENYQLSLFTIFLIFGVLIEYFKNFMVRIWGFRYFKTIDDVMDLSFAAALGYTFFENFFHFLLAFSGNDPEVNGPIKMIKFFLFQEFFILPIHLFCSGIFGYFYGLGLFAGQELQEKNHKDPFFMFLSVIFFFLPKTRVFKAVKILQGTMLSVFFYSLFFTILEYDPSIADLFRWGGLSEPKVNEKLMPIISFVFFKFGTVILFSLMDQKRRWKFQGMMKA